MSLDITRLWCVKLLILFCCLFFVCVFCAFCLFFFATIWWRIKLYIETYTPCSYLVDEMRSKLSSYCHSSAIELIPHCITLASVHSIDIRWLTVTTKPATAALTHWGSVENKEGQNKSNLCSKDAVLITWRMSTWAWEIICFDRVRILYTSLFVQKEQQARKQTIKKQQQTNINKADRHILARLRPPYIISPDMLLTSPYRRKCSLYFFQVIDIVDLTPISRENILLANFCFLRK